MLNKKLEGENFMLEYLFQPFTIKNVTFPNRIVVSAMVTNFCNADGSASERYIAYHEEKAKGGFGMIITEDYAVSVKGKGFRNVAGIWNKELKDSHKKLTERVHKYDSKIIAQIYHAGRQTHQGVTGYPPEAPSPVPCPANRQIPHELTKREIQEIIKDFGTCAKRCKEAGFDGIELHGGHGYLIAEFMSSYSNKRTDYYGGSLTNRMRFVKEVIAEVRKQVGNDFIVGFRISADEMVPGGRTKEDTKTIAIMLEGAGIDFLHISAGVYGSSYAIAPPQAVNHGWLTDFAKEVKELVRIPVITVGRINDPFIADQIIRSGKADFITMARASLCDPHMPEKAKCGDFDSIRYCIGCSQGCMGVLLGDKPIRCALNPLMGREYEFAGRKAITTKKVMVIGGGPAGMQAAITAAEQGHRVQLYEKNDKLGGQYRVAAIPPNKGELASFIFWQSHRLQQLGVSVHMEMEVTSEFVKKSDADAIIIATGGTAIVPSIPGVTHANVVVANDILEGKTICGSKAIVIGGGQIGAETALHLAVHRKNVTIVEMTNILAPKETAHPREFLLKAIEDNKINVLLGSQVKEIKEKSIIVKVAAGQVIELSADTIILATGMKPVNYLADELKECDKQIITIGDAKEIRQVMDAVSDGFEAAMNL